MTSYSPVPAIHNEEKLAGSETPPDVVKALFGDEGVAPRDRHVVIVLDGGSLLQAESAAAAAGRQASAWDANFAASSVHGMLVIALGVPPIQPASGVTRVMYNHLAWLRSVVADIQKAVDYEGEGVWIGAGGPMRGAAGVRSSYREALDALSIGRILYREPSAVLFDDVVAYRVISSDPAYSSRLTAVLNPLNSYRRSGGGEEIISILEAYFEFGTVKAVARHLHVHRHTVSRRIEIAERLLGRSVRSGHDRIIVEMAILLRRLSEAGQRLQTRRSVQRG